MKLEVEHFWSSPGWHGYADGRTHLDLAGLSHEHALEHLGEVSQVEGVMRLCWCGQQLGCDGQIHAESGINQGLVQVFDCKCSCCRDRGRWRACQDGDSGMRRS